MLCKFVVFIKCGVFLWQKNLGELEIVQHFQGIKSINIPNNDHNDVILCHFDHFDIAFQNIA